MPFNISDRCQPPDLPVERIRERLNRLLMQLRFVGNKIVASVAVCIILLQIPGQATYTLPCQLVSQDRHR